jgi:hypothetical protein
VARGQLRTLGWRDRRDQAALITCAVGRTDRRFGARSEAGVARSGASLCVYLIRASGGPGRPRVKLKVRCWAYAPTESVPALTTSCAWTPIGGW